MNIYEKLVVIQTQLRAPKGQYNAFGKYRYRSLEDISEAVKPILTGIKATLTISDKPVMIGQRIYIEATAILTDAENPKDVIINTAYARESETKKGMDDSQITGATSSYARKYCLNGLFCIDDNKDADSMEPEKPKKALVLGKENLAWLASFCTQRKMTDKDKEELKGKYGFDPYKTTDDQFKAIKEKIEADYASV